MKPIPSTLLILISLWSATSSAQFEPVNSNLDDDEKRWWQVEVLIFKHGNNTAYSNEVWPTELELNYPEEWQELLPYNDPSAEEIKANETSTSASIQSNTVNPNASNSGTVNNGVTTKPSYDNSETLYLISEDEFGLNDTHRGIERSGRRVLFHKAWRQSLEQNREEKAILITGGDQYDDHFELEGSVKIYLQRLLHFETNLWLSEFSINTGQESMGWPELPTRPNQLLAYGRGGEFNQTDSNSFSNFGTNSQQQESPNTFSDNRYTNSRSIGEINTRSWLDQRGNTTFYDSRYDEILSRSYVLNNLVQMKQDRPMRSSELHYIDHPQFGILVQITPYEEPEINPDTLLENN